MIYDASLHCDNAWRCLSKRAEQLSRKSSRTQRTGDGHGSGGGGATSAGDADGSVGSSWGTEDVRELLPRWVGVCSSSTVEKAIILIN